MGFACTTNVNIVLLVSSKDLCSVYHVFSGTCCTERGGKGEGRIEGKREREGESEREEEGESR